MKKEEPPKPSSLIDHKTITGLLDTSLSQATPPRNNRPPMHATQITEEDPLAFGSSSLRSEEDKT